MVEGFEILFGGLSRWKQTQLVARKDGGSSEWYLRKQGSFLVIIYVSLCQFIYLSISNVPVSLANDCIYARHFSLQTHMWFVLLRTCMRPRNSRVPKLRIDGTCRILCGPREADAILFFSFAFPFRTWPTLGAIEISIGKIESEYDGWCLKAHVCSQTSPRLNRWIGSWWDGSIPLCIKMEYYHVTGILWVSTHITLTTKANKPNIQRPQGDSTSGTRRTWWINEAIRYNRVCNHNSFGKYMYVHATDALAETCVWVVVEWQAIRSEPKQQTCGRGEKRRAGIISILRGAVQLRQGYICNCTSIDWYIRYLSYKPNQ